MSLHGHIHESRGVAQIGRTVCLNPGSNYADGVLDGAIVDLEGDRTMGKLSEPDFEALRADYESQALAALRELDALGELSARDRELEAEIAQVRARLRCPSCGGARVGSERCSRCGE